MTTKRSVRPLLILAGLSTGWHVQGCSTPPSIPVLTATVSDLDMVTLRWVTIGGYDKGAQRLVYIHGPRLYPPEGFFPTVDDVGYQEQSRDGETVSVSFRMSPGRQTYVLELHGNDQETVTRSVTVDIVPPSPPVVISANPAAVDPFNPQATTIAWSFSPPGDPAPGTVTVTRPDGTTETASGTHYIVTADASTRFGDVVQTWSLTHCKKNAEGASICSEASRVAIDRRGAIFDWARSTSPSGAIATLSWSGPGNKFGLRSPTLTLDPAAATPNEKWIGGTSLSIAAPPDGPHLIQSVACKLLPDLTSRCVRLDVRSPAAGTVSYLVRALADVRASTPIATVTDASGKVTTIASPVDARIESLGAPDASKIARDAVLASLTPYALTVLHVGESSTWTEADLETDFNSTSAASSRSIVYPVNILGGAGLPMDVLLDGTSIWGLGGFQLGFVGIVDGVIAEHLVPLFESNADTRHGTVMQRTTPFGNLFAPGGTIAVSALGQRIIEGAPGQIWFTQGGGGTGTSTDHARVIRFDTSGSDDPATADDDRFCVYAVPESANDVYGLAWARGRIWYTEARGHDTPRHSVVGTFDPRTIPCQNFLDYQDPQQVDAIAYCSEPFAPGCITRIDVPDAVYLAHIGVDPAPPSGSVVLWMTELFGAAIDRLTYTPPDTVRLDRFAVPRSTREPGATFPGPWRIEADERFVYFSELGDADLVRFDKRRLNDPDCTQQNVHGKNPCMSELHVPLRVPSGVNAIQLATIKGEPRLYFALDSGALGYARTSTWDGGTLYTGMDALVDRQRRDVAGPSFNGISIGPAAIAISDPARHQLIRLQMK